MTGIKRESSSLAGIRSPISTDKESGIQYVESEINGVESKIQAYLGSLYMGRVS